MAGTALITGASSGIGLELARVFAAHQYDLILIARDAAKLEKIKEELEAGTNSKSGEKISVTVLAKDLGTANAAAEIYAQASKLGKQVSVLVNNAGFAEYGKFAESELKKQQGMIDLNISALTDLTFLFVKDMASRRSGKILNVASTAAFQPGPLMAVYYASKAYVLSFSEALRNELHGTGVTVTALCPGPTKTAFFSKSPEVLKTNLLKRSGGGMSATAVAHAAFSGLMRGQAIVIPGFSNKLLAFSTRFGPRSLVTAISRWTMEQK